MKYLVAAVLCVGFIFSVCDAACFHMPPPRVKFGVDHIRGCIYEGKLRHFGRSWITKRCEDCSCDSDGSVHCCTKLGLPMAFDRNRCEYTEDMKTCTWKLVLKEDPTKEC